MIRSAHYYTIQYSAWCSFPQGFSANFSKAKSDHKHLTDVLFKLLALHQFFAAHKKHERAVWRTQHTVDFIDSDITVLGSFLSSLLKHITVQPAKDENEHFDPCEVRELPLRN